MLVPGWSGSTGKQQVLLAWGEPGSSRVPSQDGVVEPWCPGLSPCSIQARAVSLLVPDPRLEWGELRSAGPSRWIQWGAVSHPAWRGQWCPSWAGMGSTGELCVPLVPLHLGWRREYWEAPYPPGACPRMEWGAPGSRAFCCAPFHDGEHRGAVSLPGAPSRAGAGSIPVPRPGREWGGAGVPVSPRAPSRSSRAVRGGTGRGVMRSAERRCGAVCGEAVPAVER